jgi:hypothetical protein
MKGWPRDKDTTVQVSLLNFGKEVIPKIPLGRNMQVANIKMATIFKSCAVNTKICRWSPAFI